MSGTLGQVRCADRAAPAPGDALLALLLLPLLSSAPCLLPTGAEPFLPPAGAPQPLLWLGFPSPPCWL